MRALPPTRTICLLAPTVALAQNNPNPFSTFKRTMPGNKPVQAHFQLAPAK